MASVSSRFTSRMLCRNVLRAATSPAIPHHHILQPHIMAKSHSTTPSSGSSPLRKKLIGTWQLVEYAASAPDNASDKHYPLGPDATGFLMYSPDGYMGVQMLTPGIKRFKLDEGSEAQWAEAGRKCHAYTGPFYLDEAGDAQGRPILVHEMSVTNMPHFKGLRQRRLMAIREESDGTYLNLSTEGLIPFGDKLRYGELKFKKVTPNMALPPADID